MRDAPHLFSKPIPGCFYEMQFSCYHDEGIHSIFYEDRDFKYDADCFANAFINDSIFSTCSCSYEIDEKNSTFKVIIKGLNIPQEGPYSKYTNQYLNLLIENTLKILDLYTHVYVSGIKNKSNPKKDYTLQLSSDPSEIKSVYLDGKNHRKLSGMKFPIEEIPDELLCPITSSIIDLPLQDQSDDLHTFGAYAIRVESRKKGHRNPFTRSLITMLLPNYKLWGELKLFMSKVNLISTLELDFESYLAYIKDKTVSFFQLRKDLGFKTSSDVNESLMKKIGLMYRHHRFVDCQCLIESALASPKFIGSHEDIQNSIKIIQVLVLFKLKRNGKSEPAFLLLNNMIDKSKYALEWLSILNQAIKFHLEKDTEIAFEKAKELHVQTSELLKGHDKKYSCQYINLKNELALNKKLSMLVRFKCQDTVLGHSKAVRRAAASGNISELKFCMDNLRWLPSFKDNNPEKGYTALHWAIKKEKVANAWLLYIKGGSLKEKNFKGVTPRDMITKSANPLLRAMLLPYMTFDLRPNEGVSVHDITNSMPLVLEALGFSKNSSAIYLYELNKIVIAPCSINNAKFSGNFKTFCFGQFKNLTTLRNLFAITRASMLDEQESIFQKMPLQFIFDLTTTGDKSSLVNLSRKTSALLCTLLSSRNLNILEREPATLSIDMGLRRLSVNLSCKFNENFLLFLKHYIEGGFANESAHLKSVSRTIQEEFSATKTKALS